MDMDYTDTPMVTFIKEIGKMINKMVNLIFIQGQGVYRFSNGSVY